MTITLTTPAPGQERRASNYLNLKQRHMPQGLLQ